jgi:hypothetical protein
MGNDVENDIYIIVLVRPSGASLDRGVPNIIDDIHQYLEKTFNYDYYGKFELIQKYKTSIHFSILSKNQSLFNELKIIYEKYNENIFIKNYWTNVDLGFSGVEVISKAKNDSMFWEEPAKIYWDFLPTDWISEVSKSEK